MTRLKSTLTHIAYGACIVVVLLGCGVIVVALVGEAMRAMQ